jgi:hypothetical protein
MEKSGEVPLTFHIAKGIDPVDLLKTLTGWLEGELETNGFDAQSIDQQALDSIFESGLCLIQGQAPVQPPLYEWIFPSKEEREKISLTVPRTDEEKEAATARRLAFRKRKADERAAQSSDPQGQSRSSSSTDAQIGPKSPPASKATAVGSDQDQPLSKRGKGPDADHDTTMVPAELPL